MVANSGFSAVKLGAREFEEFRDFLQSVSGIELGDNKQYLVSTRIRRILIDYNFENLAQLTDQIKRPANRDLRQKVIDVMTTNETFWFRDTYPFDYLKNTVFPEILKKNASSRLRLWSAACSSGQEPYSISMITEEFKKQSYRNNGISLEIVATDLSSEILELAKEGVYDQLSVSRGLSDKRMRDFFDKDGDGVWRAKPEIRKRISFRPVNLQDSFTSLGKFDIVFCRNVLIYFSGDLKTDILQRIHATLKPGGILFLGSSESLSGAAHLFEMVHCNPGLMYRAK